MLFRSVSQSRYNSEFDLPNEIQDDIKDWVGLAHDGFVEIRSEFSPCGDETWKGRWTQEELENYYKDQIDCGNFEGTLEEFIIEYGLKVDKYLIDQKFDDLLDVDINSVLIDTSW